MKNRLFTRTGVCWLIAIGAASILGVASAQDAPDAKGKIKGVAAGSDYLQTGPGTVASLPINGQMVQVTFQGVPIIGKTGPEGNTDTIVQRAEDAVFPAEGDPSPNATIAIPITMTALNLQGTLEGPSGNTCTVTLTLAPAPASKGKLYLTTTSATGGTYHSEVTVHFMATFSPAATCYKPLKGTCKFSQKGGTWSINPLPGEYLVTGSYGDVNANYHISGMPPGYTDFFMSQAQTDVAATATHATCEALAAAGSPCSSTGQ